MSSHNVVKKRVKYAYTASDAQELTISVGQVVELIRSNQTGWSLVRLTTGETGSVASGWVPTSYLEDLPASNESSRAPASDAQVEAAKASLQSVSISAGHSTRPPDGSRGGSENQPGQQTQHQQQQVYVPQPTSQVTTPAAASTSRLGQEEISTVTPSGASLTFVSAPASTAPSQSHTAQTDGAAEKKDSVVATTSQAGAVTSPEGSSDSAPLLDDLINCCICKEKVGDSYYRIRKGERKYVIHGECFRCHSCKGPLGDKYVVGDDGNLYCKDDYLKHFGTRCAGCNEFIEGAFVTVNQKSFHPDCYTCHLCKNKITGGTVLDDAGNFVCLNCQEKVLPKCTDCGQTVSGSYILFNDKPYHKTCIRCSVDGEVIEDNVRQTEDNKFICEKHFLEALPNCGACNQKLTTEWMSVGDQKYHPDCFKCTKCGKKIAGKVFMIQGKFHCDGCA